MGGLHRTIFIAASVFMVTAILAFVAVESETISMSQPPNFRVIDTKLTSDYKNIQNNAYFVMNFINYGDRNINTLIWKTYDDTGKEFSDTLTNISGKQQISFFGESANTVFTEGVPYTMNLFFYFENGNEYHYAFDIVAGV